ncbi:hypothetical protein NDU88_005757 [Pleurodeles waltl]|uniref:DDE Tnp4 domain-containing protein n=1 Tax=Pleurodeles waltl TaxID=8319 RepID=A0AAV7W8Q3_PLEWA|nr:hypothetical protein NDU88_005757 [Pleurodeles waltl]
MCLEGFWLPCSNKWAALSHSSRVDDLTTVKAGFYAMGCIPHVIEAIDRTHIALVPPWANEQVYGNRKSFHSLNVQTVCLADQYISHVTTEDPGSVHDAFVLRNSSVPHVMARLQRQSVWLIGELEPSPNVCLCMPIEVIPHAIVHG